MSAPAPLARPRDHRQGSAGHHTVGYLVVVPEGTDPSQLPRYVARAGTTRVTALPEPPPPEPHHAVVRGDGVEVDRERHTVHVDGSELDLTYLEFELLAHLVANPYRVHSRTRLTETIWGHTFVGDGRTVDVHIARLRRKIGAPHRDRIVTVRRVGYKYVPDDGT